MTARPLAVFILGAGRLGGALALALSAAGHQVATMRRSAAGRRATAALGIPGPVFPPSAADVVLLCVPDKAVEEAARTHAASFSRRQVVAHCAGALDLTPLDAAARQGAHIGSLHPLCAVPSAGASLEGAAAAVEGDGRAVRVLTRLARDARMRPFRLHSGERALYHAAAVLASNCLVALADEATLLLGRCGLDRRTALAALLPLMQSALDGLQRERLPGALTGPIARGDSQVIEAHLRALRDGPDSACETYRALGTSLVRLSRELGAADPEDSRRIESMLARRRRPGARRTGPE